MRRMIGRLISVVLSAAMLIGSITVPVSAADLPDVSVGSAYETELEAEAEAEADAELETTGEEELLAEEEITDADPAEEEELLAEEEPGEDPDESEALEEVDEDASLQDTASRDRDLRQNVTVRFNDDGTTHYKIVGYSYYDASDHYNTDGTNNGYDFTTKVNEDFHKVWFLIEPEEGYTLVGVTCDEVMDISAELDTNKIWLTCSRFSANELHINVTVRSNNGNEYVNTVQYNDILLDAKLYKVGETDPLTPVNYTDIDGYSVSEYSYLLDKTAKYNLKVTPKQEGVLLGTLDISPRIGSCLHIQPKNNAHDYTINIPADGTNFFINYTEYMHFVFKYDESQAGIGSTSANPFAVTRAYYTVPGAIAGAADRNINLVASAQKTSGGVYEYAVPINSPYGETKRVFFNINGLGNGALLYVTDMRGNVYDYDAATGACQILVSSITRGEYVYKVTTTKKDFKVNVKDAFGDPITPLGISYSINRREDVTILHENSFGVKAGLSSLTLRYPDGTTETIGPLYGDESYTIPAGHISPKYAGKTITASLLTKATVASGQTFMLSVKPEITKVTIQGAQTMMERVGTTTVQYQKITQEVGSSKTYNIVLQANERNTADSLIIKNPNNYAQDAVSASIVDVNKVEIITKKSDPMTLAGTFEIWNNETDQKVADVKVATTQPSWTNYPITAVQTASTDVSVTMRVSTPVNVKFTDDDDFYYVVNLSKNNALTKLKEGYELRDTEDKNHMICFKASEVAANGGLITFNPYTDDANVYITESGRGFGTSFNASVSLVRTEDGKPPCYPDESYVFAKTARPLNAIASTKNPYYSDRIIIKSDLTCNTNLYIGQRKKVGIVDFGTQATYVTNDYWKIKSIKDAQGNDASGYFICGKIGDMDANGNVLTDNGIYVDVLSYNYALWKKHPEEDMRLQLKRFRTHLRLLYTLMS